MLFYFDFITGNERVRDTEGAVFPDLQAANSEALQSAREQSAELLRSGKAFPAEWRVEVIDGGGCVKSVISFAELLADATRSPATTETAAALRQTHRLDLSTIYYRSVSQETRTIAAELRATCAEIWQSLATINK